MRQIEIYSRETRGEHWRVVSYGNGTAYLLECVWRGEKTSVFFQGDDAAEFRERTMGDDGFFIDDVERVFADYSDAMERD